MPTSIKLIKSAIMKSLIRIKPPAKTLHGYTYLKLSNYML